jgi:hypothetical protein
VRLRAAGWTKFGTCDRARGALGDGVVIRTLLLRFEKALLPVAVILDPCNGTQKFALLRAEPTGRERCGEK